MEVEMMLNPSRFIYNSYRKQKAYFLKRPSGLLTNIVGKTYFRWVNFFAQLISERKTLLNQEYVDLWRQLYFLRFGAKPLFKLEAAVPIALDSDDHKWPRGTMTDNSVNLRFNTKLYQFFQNESELKVLDLGCSGGGFVRSVLADGHTAIGIEGSDYSQYYRSGEWGNIPHHLFTGDITAEFQLYELPNTISVKFDCITLWEVLEHIPEAKIHVLIQNIKNHLAPNGICVASVDVVPDGDLLTGAVYHQTLRPKSWWLAQFYDHALVEVSNHNFCTQDYVRGHGQGWKDWSPDEPEGGFHLVLKRA